MAGNPRKPVIGLLGGIGSGKSTVAAELVRLGCGLVDADAIGHELLEEPQVKEQIRRLWGPEAFDEAGRVDRAALAEIVFRSPDDLAALNAVMHPRMRRRMAERIESLLAKPEVPAVVVDAALLLETNWHELCSTFVFVSAPDRLRTRRVAEARNWDQSTWKQRENSQKPLDIKASRAEHVIDNSSDLPCLRERVRSLFHRIVHAVDYPQE